MKKRLIMLAVAVLVVFPGLASRLSASENGTKPPAEQAEKAAESQKAEEAKKIEEAKKAADEAAKKIIVARVNGAEINMFLLTQVMNGVAPKYIKEGETGTPEITGKIRSEALNKLIFEELAVQAAIKAGINPGPEAIEKVVAQVKENLGSEEAYRGYLDKNRLTEDVLKKLIERSQRFELITAREVYGKVTVDEKLLREEYEKEKGRFVLPDNFIVEDVWFVKDMGEAARKHADEVLKIIKEFGNDAHKLTLDGTFIIRKITIKKQKYPEIYKSMTEMNVGDLSGLIEEKDGFHIIKVLKKEPSRQATFEETRGALEPKFLVPAQEQRKEEWGNELKKDAKIEILLDEMEKK